ncbi:hypothetical protein LJR098_001056 [Rhizobium sp. LjRoot98]|uniref:hypothetical protein n=1 Tax=Rhizobium sp. LjRoot98 TaxID=3342345 RepID=UPI003ECC6CB8
MMGKIATAASMMFIVMVIMSCATTIPSALLTCKDEPRYIGRSSVSAADLLEFTDKVAVAGADCRSKLAAVRKIEAHN